MKIYSIFHASLLESAPQTTKAQKVEIEPETQEYEVEKILDKDQIDSQDHWLVKWKGFLYTKNTWEPIENLQDAQGALKDFAQKRTTQDQTSQMVSEQRVQT